MLTCSKHIAKFSSFLSRSHNSKALPVIANVQFIGEAIVCNTSEIILGFTVIIIKVIATVVVTICFQRLVLKVAML